MAFIQNWCYENIAHLLIFIVNHDEVALVIDEFHRNVVVHFRIDVHVVDAQIHVLREQFAFG